MRKSALLIVLLLVSGSVVPLLAATDLPRHVDPGELVAEKPYPVNLFYLYHLFFQSLVDENFSDAPPWLLMAFEVYAPADVKVVIDRLDQLLGSEMLSLNATKATIEAALTQLRRMNVAETKALVREALVYLSDANMTMSFVEDSQRSLSSLLGASPDPMLSDSADVRRLILEYRETLTSILDRANGINDQVDGGSLLGTSMFIVLNETRVQVGSHFKVVGFLTLAGGSPLAAFRVVDLLVDGSVVDSVVTDESGGFQSVLKAPYLYKEAIIVGAEYWPSGVDADRLLPSFSNTFILPLLYSTPVLELTLPDLCYPGMEAEIGGSVSVDGVGISGLEMTVYCLSGVYEAESGDAGVWGIKVPVPSNSTEGASPVYVESGASGVFGPSSAVGFLDVVRLASTVSLSSPGWSASSTGVNLSGVARVGDEPLVNAVIRVVGGVGEQSVRTDGGGSFSAVVNFPSPLLSTSLEYKVVAVPVEPWIRTASTSSSILLVNLYTLLGGPGLLILGLAYGGRALRRGRKAAEPAPVIVEAPAAVVAAPRAETPVSVGDFYARSVSAVSGVTGVVPSPNQTFREYYSLVKGRLPDAAAEIFRVITVKYERVVYGDSITSDDGELQGLYSRLMEALSG